MATTCDYQCGRKFSRARATENGSVLVLTTMMIVVLVGMIGLAMDGGAMYVTQQKAQAAADAAAQAGVMDMYRGTTNGGVSYGTAHTCTTTDPWTPCWYARQDGFGSTNADVVTVDFAGPGVTGGATAAWCNVTGVSLSNSDSVNLICVKVQRTLNTMLMRVIGQNTSLVATTAIAAISATPSPLPIVVIHPTLSGSFSNNGNKATLRICGGPSRSIQVNSTSTTSIPNNISGAVDLSHAGPLDSGACDTGTGGDFANVAAETSYPGSISLGTKPGVYVASASPISDPLLSVSAPSQPAAAAAPVSYTTSSLEAAHNCPTSCTVYSPGYYPSGIQVKSDFAVFRPGIYWINHGGFQLQANSIARMASAAVDKSDPTGLTSWTQNVMFYNSPSTPVKSNSDIFSISSNSGQINNQTYPDSSNGCASGGNCLMGSPSGSAYDGILFFQNRSTATSLSHSLDGGSALNVTGTIYLTHTAAGIKADGTYQSLTLNGGSGGNTKLQGEIVVDALSYGGNSAITMNLIGTPTFTVRQVALVQ